MNCVHDLSMAMIWGMLAIGRINKLKYTRQAEQGAYFASMDGKEEILLPRRFVEADLKVDDEKELFVCYDSEDRLMATTEWPFAMVGEFAHLKVKSTNRIGAFLDWGLGKDLLLPFSEQTRDLKVHDYVVVYIYLDNTDRIASSMRLDRFLNKSEHEFTEKQEVQLMIAGQSPLGIKAIINGTHWGLLYKNEVFERLTPGQKMKGYVKVVRPDGKIDLSLQKQGHQAAEPIGELILEKLRNQGGFLNLTEKTDPKRIYELFGVSKKKYKMALGGLYKKRLILIQDDGIRLISK